MTRFVVDAGVVLQLVAGGKKVSSAHELLAPTLLRSQTLSALHGQVRAGKLDLETARARHEAISKLPIRLLGDAVLRRLAWKIAGELGWETTYDAEYVALTKLQADAFVTLDKKLARSVKDVVDIAPVDALFRK